MKKMIRILTLFLVIVSMIGVSGCMSKLTPNNEEQLKEKAIQYLESKYEEEFLYISFYKQNIDVPYDELIFTPIKEPESRFSVYVEDDIYSDNYYGTLIHDDYQELIDNIIKEKIPNTKCYFTFTAGYFGDEFTKDVSLSDALEKGSSQFFSNTYVFFDKEELINETDFEKICEQFISHNLELYIAFYGIDADSLSVIGEENYIEFIQDNYDLDPIYKKTIK